MSTYEVRVRFANVRRGMAGAEALACRLDRPMGVLGLLFVLVVLGQALARDAVLVAALTLIGWLRRWRPSREGR